MGVFSGFGGGGAGDDVGYAYRLRQWLQDNEDQRKLDEVNALRQSFGPMLEQRLRDAQDPTQQAALQAQIAMLKAAGPNSLDDISMMLRAQQQGDVVGATPTNDMREYMLAKRQGYAGGIAQWLKDQHDGTTPAVTKQYEYLQQLPPDQREMYMRVMKMNTPGIITADTTAKEQAAADVKLGTAGPIASKEAEGKALPERLASIPAAIEGHLGVLDTADIVDQAAAELESIIQANPLAVGAGSAWLSQLGSTDATRVKNLLQTIAANEVAAAMAKARASSPTGATGYGALSEGEREMMEKSRVALSQMDNPKAVLGALADLRKLNETARERALKAWEKDYRWNERYKAAAPSAYREVMPPPDLRKPAASATPAPAGGGPVKVSTPEEARALPPGTRFMAPDGTVRIR